MQTQTPALVGIGKLSTHGKKETVPPEIFEHWRRQYRHGDTTLASKQSGFSRVVIQHALLYGFAQEPVRVFLSAFYNRSAPTPG
jgi:hypothetical protein